MSVQQQAVQNTTIQKFPQYIIIDNWGLNSQSVRPH